MINMQMNENYSVKENANEAVRTFENELLRCLYKEIHKISSSLIPAKVKQSPTMKELFVLEDAPYYEWLDRYHNVRSAIENEILFRIRHDRF